ncbi:hypothetical protein [uncultured Victivallis sp.]|uniref:hypothetical protein n=1 Tax=uncultured Victivallis sp. TaxID=354118 RepID=UPI0025990C80|nr:hypothetical protein [uncultured Victivallis sp.]
MRTYRCCDGMCGAYDCAKCHPEFQSLCRCPGCGERYPLWAFTGELCPNCEEAGLEQCEECGEWIKAGELSRENRCPECEKEHKLEEAI